MDDINRLRTLFDAVRELESEPQRQRLLDDACGNDQTLRSRVNALLAADRDAGSFLQADDQAEVTVQTTASNNVIGTQIGRYKLRERLAEGGMGIVYVADQTEPVRRRVALKVIKPGMASKDVVARFEAERQALAMMDHPNIARIFDGGATESGQSFFAMELVLGLPITDYCDEHRLSPPERLELFGQVCRAVQHAHHKGIIHRDIKPSNVLVATIDGAAVSKVIDFGVAKALNQKLSEETIYTQLAQMVGTPLYMSPEQVDFGILDIDTRSDVYSLGVLLYELLTGNTPFDRETLKRSGFDEFRRILREEEPRRPSHAVSTLMAEVLSTVCERRTSDPRRLAQSLRGELDWVVMKALEKDRNRRYESPNAMAADVERYLHNEPVTANPPSIRYRIRKFTQRNRRSLIAAAFIGVVLIGGAIWATGTKLEHDRQRRQLIQDSQQSLAATEALVDHGDLSTAEQQIAELHGRLLNVDLRVPELHAMVRQLSDEIEARKTAQECFQQFEALAGDAMDDMPHGEDDDGMLWGLQALELYGVLDDDQWMERLRGSYLDPQQQEVIRKTAYELLLVLADAKVRWEDSRTEPTAQECLRYLEIAAAFHEPTRALYWVRSECYRYLKNDERAKADSARFKEATANTAFDYFLPGHTAAWRGDLEEAIRSYKAALRIQPDHFNSLFFLAMRLTQLGKNAEAAEVYRACLALRPDDVLSLRNRADILSRMGELEEALELVNKAIQIPEGRTSASTMGNRGSIHLVNGELKNALADFDRALELANRKDVPDVSTIINIHDHRAEVLDRLGKQDRALAELNVAVGFISNGHSEEVHFYTYAHRASLLANMGVYDRAFQDIENAFRVLAELKATTPSEAVANARRTRARILLYTGRQTEALSECDKALQLATEHQKDLILEVHCIHASALHDLARYEEEVREFNAIIEPVTKPPSKMLIWAYNALAWTLATCPNDSVRDISRAIELANEAVKFDPSNGDYRNTLGAAQYRAGDYESAAASLRKSHHLDNSAAVANDLFLAMAYWQLGKEDEAHQRYHQAVRRMAESQDTDDELLGIKAEAEATLSIVSDDPKIGKTAGQLGNNKQNDDSSGKE